MRVRKHRLLYVFALLALSYLAFKNLAEHGLTYDDLDYIKNTGVAQGNISHIFSSDKAWSGRPAGDLLLYLAYKSFGESPRGYHLLSVFLHLLASLLLAHLVLGLTRSAQTAAVSGFLFLLNCIHFRAIYWVSAIGYPLAACCLLTAISLFLKALGVTGLPP